MNPPMFLRFTLKLLAKLFLSKPVRRGARRPVRPRVLCPEGRIVPSTFTELELNNTIGTANLVSVPTGDILGTTSTDWLNINGSVASGTDADTYRFTLGSKAGVFFDIHSRDMGLSTTLDSILSLFA